MKESSMLCSARSKDLTLLVSDFNVRTSNSTAPNDIFHFSRIVGVVLYGLNSHSLKEYIVHRDQ